MKNYMKGALIVLVAAITLVTMCALDFHAWAQSDMDNEKSSGISAKSDETSDAKTASKDSGDKSKSGERIGKKIEQFTERTGSHLGGWINRDMIAGITWFKMIISLLLLFAIAVIERFVRAIIDRGRKKIPDEIRANNIKALILDAITKPVSLFIWVNGIILALSPVFLVFQKPDGKNLVYLAVQKGADLGTAVAIIWFIFNLVSIVDSRLKSWAATTESTIDDILAPLVGKTLRLFIIIIGGVLIVQNLTGVEIGPLLASLGIGGLAVALAARDSIANFFGTLTILFDKPFQVGHRVIIDGKDGTVESVGFRSTRIRMLTGHLLTIPNEKIVNTSVENIGMRPHIRWLANITITYDTAPDKVEKAVSVIKEILNNHEGMHEDFPPRVFFNGFNDWSLNIMVIAWYHPPNYWDMQAWLQQTCLEILRRFNEEGIDFAFPSRTIFLANDDQRQLKLEMLQGETSTYIPEGGSHE